MESWKDYMMPSGNFDKISRMIVAVLLGIWLIGVGLTFHAEYPRELIELAGQPWWRLLVVVGAIAAAYWCPRVGILAAIAVVVYLADLRALTTI